MKTTGYTSTEICAKTGISLACLRKYVQHGLVPKSKRIGILGRYRGSMGIYPKESIIAIKAVKKLLAKGKSMQEVIACRAIHSEALDLKYACDHTIKMAKPHSRNKELTAQFRQHEKMLRDSVESMQRFMLQTA